MAKTPTASNDRYEHLRNYATAQKQTTVERLRQAISRLEAEGRPVNTFTIKEVGGLDYMAYYRNREAYALFQEHSTHLCEARQKELAKRQAARAPSKSMPVREREAVHTGGVSHRDPMLDYKKPRLLALVYEARQERDQARKGAQAEKAQLTQKYEAEYAQLQQRYRGLLQDHMQCGLTIARLEAQIAESQAFIDRLRSSLRREEFGSGS